jgi:hypothetical protein
MIPDPLVFFPILSTLTVTAQPGYNGTITPGRPQPDPRGSGRWTTSLGAILTGVFWRGRGSRRRGSSRLLFLMALALLTTITDCGGDYGGSDGNKGTPAGTSMVTGTASSRSITHIATFILNVK